MPSLIYASAILLQCLRMIKFSSKWSGLGLKWGAASVAVVPMIVKRSIFRLISSCRFIACCAYAKAIAIPAADNPKKIHNSIRIDASIFMVRGSF